MTNEIILEILGLICVILLIVVISNIILAKDMAELARRQKEDTSK